MNTKDYSTKTNLTLAASGFFSHEDTKMLAILFINNHNFNTKFYSNMGPIQIKHDKAYKKGPQSFSFLKY